MTQQANRIPGGYSTVIRFFILSISYTAVWLAIGSQLGYFRKLFGPRMFLEINIAYYAPSIPILLIESLFDEPMELAFGVGPSILVRSLISLIGYGALSFAFPFLPLHRMIVLFCVMGIGSFSSLAFSASYQLVARFSSNNVVALGLGCSASGPIVLILELLIGFHSTPSFKQLLVLFSTLTAFVFVGIWCVASLMTQFWDDIQESTDGEIDGRQGEEQQEHEHEELLLSPRFSMLPRRLSATASVLPYNMLEPHSQPYIAAANDWFPAASEVGLGTLTSQDYSALLAHMDLKSHPSMRMSIQTHDSEDEEALSFAYPEHDAPEQNEASSNMLLTTVKETWPCLLGMLIQCSTSLVILPFFTYMASSGVFEDSLPKILFFSRIFADFTGRYLPRITMLAPDSQMRVFLLSCTKIFAMPFYFLYLEAPSSYHNDFLLLAFVAVMWGISGYVNTATNMLAPNVVQPYLKSTAAGLMALMYQVGHFLGLAIAALCAYVLYHDR